MFGQIVKFFLRQFFFSTHLYITKPQEIFPVLESNI